MVSWVVLDWDDWRDGMTDIRQAVLAALERHGRTRYWLAHHPRAALTPNAIYLWLRSGTDIRSEAAGRMLRLVGLGISPVGKPVEYDDIGGLPDVRRHKPHKPPTKPKIPKPSIRRGGRKKATPARTKRVQRKTQR